MGFENIDLEIEYKDLVKDLIDGIPQLSREWTDHNPADFGVMILELYAYLSDQYLYRVNRVDAAVLTGFLNNYVISGADAELKNTNVNDAQDIRYSELKAELGRSSPDIEAILRAALRFFHDPYRLISKQDVITVCKTIVPTLGMDYVLLGIHVDHFPETHRFKVVVSISRQGIPLGMVEVQDAVKDLTQALEERKLLGSVVEVKAAQVASVVKVDVKLKLSTRTSEWNRDQDNALIKSRVKEYFGTTATGSELSLHQVVSLFEIYSFIEDLEMVDYVERVLVQIHSPAGDLLLTDRFDGAQPYQVIFEFNGAISIENTVIEVERIL
ncbi:MAG: hypothetical protein AB7G93_15380 [Bdellovibrionales bacterium]